MLNTRLSLKLLSIVEATTINAVARNVLEFYRSARELEESSADFPSIAGGVVTFEQRRSDARSSNEFANAVRESGLELDVIPERRRFDLRVIPALRNAVEQYQPDIVVTHSVKSHFLLWRSQLWKDVPWVAFHHGTPPPTGRCASTIGLTDGRCRMRIVWLRCAALLRTNFRNQPACRSIGFSCSTIRLDRSQDRARSKCNL